MYERNKRLKCRKIEEEKKAKVNFPNNQLNVPVCLLKCIAISSETRFQDIYTKKENNWKITRKNKLQKHNTTRIISHKLDLTVIKDEFVNTTFIKLGNHQHDVKL